MASTPKRRVVVTGLGLVTPLGPDVETTWAGLLAGRSGAAPITKFDPARLGVRFACEVKGFDPLQYMDRKEARRYDLFAQFALVAAGQAMESAGLADDLGDVDPHRFGVIFGSGIGGISTFEEQHRTMLERGPKRVPGRLVVAVSSGTPVTATSTPLRSFVYLRRMNDVTPA